jgi:hypothetical protein
MFKLGKNESKTAFKINWKLFIVSYLACNLGCLTLVIVYGLLTGARDLSDDVFVAITVFQVVCFFLTGMLMGYWAGEWPRWEMMLIFVSSIQTSLSRNLKSGLDLQSLVVMIGFLALYGGSLLGGGMLGIKLKQRKKPKIRITTESEVPKSD